METPVVGLRQLGAVSPIKASAPSASAASQQLRASHRLRCSTTSYEAGTRARRARVWLAFASIAATDGELAAASADLDRELRGWFVAQGLAADAADQMLALVDGVTFQCLVLPLAGRRSLVERTVIPFLARLDPGSGPSSDGISPEAT
ncbi:hypothetical protein [Nocardioides faecalis]|uniref:hypothetical protein n=1 Tax=Nocardioides faecalis TaxID=2803858 RepID=UPI0027DC775D|nr:hypothetical protein [Nocardioides faecalis]